MASDADAMLRDAVLLDRAGRTADAIAVYERLLARWPDRPNTWYNLALLQRKARRYESALASYQQALDRGVSRPEEVHLNRSVIYADHLRRDAAAASELAAALELNPRYVPALLNLANLDEDFGRREQARALYERILEIDPRCTLALARLAGVAVVSSLDDPLIARLEEATRRAGTDATGRANLGFALGRLLDACGAYQRAFEAYRAANDASRASGAPRPRYDRVGHERFVDALIAAFPEPRHDVATDPAGVEPIFVCGMFRSGSTLTEQVLARHPRVAAGGEVDVLPALVASELAPYPASMARVSAAALADLGGRYLRTLSGLHPGADYVTDKRPDNFLNIGLIKTLFPDARIVHTTRNALDNCLSIYFLHLDHRMSYALDLRDIGHYYRQYRRLMAHWHALYGNDILDFGYEAYVRDPGPALGRLLGFCRLDTDDYGKRGTAGGAVKTASVWQVREPLHQRSVGRWRNYAQQLAGLEEELGELPSTPAAGGVP
jgi:tetratricopeptide (TPR) repeat protein